MQTTMTGMPHVLPYDDLRPHEVLSPCWCSPTLDRGVFVHHALDQRETFEPGGDRYPRK